MCSSRRYLRASPSHEWILPATSTLQDIPVYPPAFTPHHATLRGTPGGLEDADGAVTQFSFFFVEK